MLNKIDHINDITHKINGEVAIVTLNRPKALNALTHEMMVQLSHWLAAWKEDDRIKAVFFKGAGDRAFCAGGDIKHACKQGLAYKKAPDVAISPNKYFYDEYTLNRTLFHYPKPLYAFMDGVTMGGGFGIAGPCKYRIATERTVFAMPEVGIGFFPDIGGVYYLLKCPDHIGRYLCLGGQSISYEDMLYSGIATHYCGSDKMQYLMDELVAAITCNGSVENVLARYEPPNDLNGAFKAQGGVIRTCFASDDVAHIIQGLVSIGSKWAQDLAMTMLGCSPLSMQVTMRHIKMAEQGEGFDAVIARDFNLCQHFMAGEDFYEGVRAAVIDKDKSPRWQHATLADVKISEIDAYFKKTGYALY